MIGMGGVFLIKKGKAKLHIMVSKTSHTKTLKQHCLDVVTLFYVLDVVYIVLIGHIQCMVT